MQHEPIGFSYESMGTMWKITIWDDIGPDALAAIRTDVIDRSTAFDNAYSRFIPSSLVWSLSERRGVVEVPRDLVEMLRLYERMNVLSDGKCNPLVGFALSDLGYDAEYSLRTKEIVRPVPAMGDALRIVDDTQIDLAQSVLIDVGALGKGYFVDVIAGMLRDRGMKRFLVDGSGDVYYEGDGVPLRMGLEHPGDATKVIGVVEVTRGAMCSSANNRRTWGSYGHTIDPVSLTSPQGIIATWVIAPTAAVSPTDSRRVSSSVNPNGSVPHGISIIAC